MTDAAATLRRKRQRRASRFRWYGRIAIASALAMLALLVGTIISQGVGAFRQTVFTLPVTLDEQAFNDRSQDGLRAANYRMLLGRALEQQFPDITSRRDKRQLIGLLSPAAGEVVRDYVMKRPQTIGTTVTLPLLASDSVDQYIKHPGRAGLEPQQAQWLAALQEQGKVERVFNRWLFTNADSREPEAAGILGAVIGSALTLLVTLLLAFPVGVAAAIYLEEFAPKSRLTTIIEVNINNLAAVPSIIFGLLGLAIFLGWFGMPRSSPLVGGCVLALMTMPTIIIASRAALKAVPPSIRQAAQGLGASPVQVVFHQVLPCALPGIMTGSIIGMAHALGETAPLLMIGMVAFIADVPSGVTSPATALPVQVYLWAESAERAYQEKTAAAIIVLLAFLLVMNAAAVWLRKRYAIKW